MKFAKREHKDWRIALVSSLLFTWLFALLILLVVPKLSDEDHERINGKTESETSCRSFSMQRGPREPMSLPTTEDVFAPLMWFLGICTAGALGVMALMTWVM